MIVLVSLSSHMSIPGFSKVGLSEGAAPGTKSTPSAPEESWG